MGSEGEPVQKRADRSGEKIMAIWLLDRGLNSLVYPVEKERLKEVTKRFIMGTFDYSSVQAETRTNILEEMHDIPGENELEDDGAEVVAESLKLGLFNKLTEEYMLLHGMEEFHKWITPFLKSVLKGHIDASVTIEHINECPEQRYCPALIVGRMVRGNLLDEPKTLEKKVEYIVSPEDIIEMNVTIIRKLEELGVYIHHEAEELLERYQWWIESLEHPLPYDADLFDSPNAA